MRATMFQSRLSAVTTLLVMLALCVIHGESARGENSAIDDQRSRGDWIVAQNASDGAFEEVDSVVTPVYQEKKGVSPAQAVATPAEDSDSQAAAEVPPAKIDDNEAVRRKEKELEAEQLYVEGRKSLIEGDFDNAVRKFISAQVKLTEVSRSQPEIVRKQELLNQLLASTYEAWANKISKEAESLAQLDKFEEAIEKFQKVIEKDPSRRAEINKRIQELQRAIKQAEFQEKTSAKNVDPEKAVRDYDIDTKVEQGKVYFNNKRYSDAREMFEQVLLKDPYNVEATRFLKRINEKLLEAGNERREVMSAERVAEIKWKWNDPVTPLVSPEVVVEGSQPVKKLHRAGEGIWAKLENIVIPKISFEDANINSVVKYLKNRSRELDPDGEGVNIFLQLAQAAHATAPVEEAAATEESGFEEFAEPSGDATEAAPAAAEPPAEEEGAGGLVVTMDFDNIPLGEAIRYICQGAGLKYKVETHAVIIASQDIPFDELETRFYPVEAGFLQQKLTREKGAGLAGGGGGADIAGRDALALFQDYGVEFPQGAKITYDQRTSKLIVTNTPANLRKVEKILAELNVQPVQVTIEAKFVEVSQSDLEELGFEWLFLGRETNGNLDVKNVNLSGDARFSINPQSRTSPLDPDLSGGLRFLTDIGDASSNDRLLEVNSVLGSLAFNTVIRALEQKQSTDVLSAPKVTTVSGQTAVLKVIEERSFPSEYSEPEFQAAAETGSGGSTGASIKPSTPEFEKQEIGVILTVTPTVASDGYSIDLELEPEVVQKIGDDDYSYNIQLGSELIRVPLTTPIISKRQIRTKVIVWDGETVVLGGMIKEDIKRTDDKVPFLGDMPVFGRLFRTEGQKSDKRNLLIFVTARLVNPAGLPIRTADIRGLPDFRR